MPLSVKSLNGSYSFVSALAKLAYDEHCQLSVWSRFCFTVCFQETYLSFRLLGLITSMQKATWCTTSWAAGRLSAAIPWRMSWTKPCPARPSSTVLSDSGCTHSYWETVKVRAAWSFIAVVLLGVEFWETSRWSRVLSFRSSRQLSRFCFSVKSTVKNATHICKKLRVNATRDLHLN